ncbi:MAG TPA: hypothetical protein VIF12_06160, partial [Micavibrio sp.]
MGISKNKYITSVFNLAVSGLLMASGFAWADSYQTPASHSHTYILNAPKLIDQWEISAAVIIDNKLWVASDKPLKAGAQVAGILAAYDLSSLQNWEELRKRCRTETDLNEGKCDGNNPVDIAVVPQAGKLEGAALLPENNVLWWDTIKNRANICFNTHQESCSASPVPFTFPDNRKLREIVKANTGLAEKDIEYVSVEGLALSGNHFWLGVRRYKHKEQGEIYWTAVVDQDGTISWGGGPLVLDGKPFSISDLTADRTGLWATLSYESLETGNNKRSDVEGRLA